MAQLMHVRSSIRRGRVRTSSGSLSRLDFMSAAVHEAISGETARGGTTARAAPGAA